MSADYETPHVYDDIEMKEMQNQPQKIYLDLVPGDDEAQHEKNDDMETKRRQSGVAEK